jgi:hypothetical protein
MIRNWEIFDDNLIKVVGAPLSVWERVRVRVTPSSSASRHLLPEGEGGSRIAV